MEDLSKLKEEYDNLSKELATPEVTSDYKKLEEFSRRHTELREILELQSKLEKLQESVSENEKILETDTDKELMTLAEEELAKDKPRLEELKNSLTERLHPEPGAHINEVIIEIRAGVGGEEASLFAYELFRMYSRYAEIKGWKVEIMDESKSDLKGIKEVTFEIIGKGSYGKLKNESGVHRVQRVPETEKNGRLHTSTASVAVLPKAKPVDIEIKPEELRIETFRSSGPGGQNVNKVETAVRITHLPTGLTVACQIHKKQPQNREAAMTLLRSRLLAAKQEEEDRKIRMERKEQIGSGDRSEKIRTYNFPQDRVTDHRITTSWHGIYKIMDGFIDDIVAELKNNL